MADRSGMSQVVETQNHIREASITFRCQQPLDDAAVCDDFNYQTSSCV